MNQSNIFHFITTLQLCMHSVYITDEVNEMGFTSEQRKKVIYGREIGS